MNFLDSLGQKIVMWSSDPAAYDGFAVSSDTLEYHVDGPSSKHSFYQGTTEIMRIAGSGNVWIPGTLSVAGSATLGSAAVATASVVSTSSFGGLATFNAGLWVSSGASALNGSLAVSGVSTFSSAVTVNSNTGILITGGGGISAGAGFFSALSVSGSSTLAAATMNSTLSVSGLTTALGGVSVTGGSLAVTNAASIGSLSVADATTLTGPVTVNNGMNIRYGTVFDFGYGAPGRDPNAGKMGYGIFDSGNSFDIVGAGTGANRAITMWDHVTVQGNLNATGTVTGGAFSSSGSLNVSGVTTLGNAVNVNAAGGGIVLKAPAAGQGWSSVSRGNFDGYLVNDRTSFNSLMIVGASTTGGSPRSIQMWDNVQINGNTTANGSLHVNGRLTTNNLNYYRAYDTLGGCPGPRAAGLAQILLTINVTQSVYVMITGSNIRNFNGRADLCLYVDGTEVNRAITYTPLSTWVSGTVTWAGALNAGHTLVHIADCTGIASIWGCGANFGVLSAITIG